MNKMYLKIRIILLNYNAKEVIEYYESNSR